MTQPNAAYNLEIFKHPAVMLGLEDAERKKVLALMRSNVSEDLSSKTIFTPEDVRAEMKLRLDQ